MSAKHGRCIAVIGLGYVGLSVAVALFGLRTFVVTRPHSSFGYRPAFMPKFVCFSP
jgi:hypothetical protein